MVEGEIVPLDDVVESVVEEDRFVAMHYLLEVGQVPLDDRAHHQVVGVERSLELCIGERVAVRDVTLFMVEGGVPATTPPNTPASEPRP
jgi:hypothetical protein